MWDTLIQLVSRFRFYITIEPDEFGILIRRGRIKDELAPGFYWLIPIMDNITVVTVTEQTIDTPNQPLMTKDGKALTISATIAYEIEDAAAAMYRVMDFDENLLQKAMPLLCEAINKRNLVECWNNKEIEDEIKLGLQDEAQHWGLKITDFRITAKTPARVLALMRVD